jgi:hypothetical protein
MIVGAADAGKLCVLSVTLDFLPSPCFNLAPSRIATFPVFDGLIVPL